MEMTFRPWMTWPGEKTRGRQHSPFRSSYDKTLNLLDAELRHLQAKNIVLQVDVDEAHVRLDGQLRANTQPRSPGIVLAFDSKHGPLSYHCDRFWDWKDNLRAIALALEALRKVDRYGVTRQAEQYKGWKALPPAVSNGWMTPEDAARLISSLAPLGVPTNLLVDRSLAAMAIRQAEFKTHPDRGGNPDEFKKVQAAREALERHHGKL